MRDTSRRRSRVNNATGRWRLWTASKGRLSRWGSALLVTRKKKPMWIAGWRAITEGGEEENG
jgi:hypothetical protein